MTGGRLVCALALALGLLGCHRGGAVDEFGELVDDYCGCADEACRDAVRARVAAFDKKRLEPNRYTDVGKLADRAHHCAESQMPSHGTTTFTKPR